METEREYYKRHGIIRAMWAIDSESGDECLIDLDNHQVVAKRVKGVIVDPAHKCGCHNE